ncbi:MAG: class I SAM-dependent methyltransferase [Ardenticatenia bacterium]|nr:class I SAM-dependent methyltransferase [Ardenticatenia bacterium]
MRGFPPCALLAIAHARRPVGATSSVGRGRALSYDLSAIPADLKAGKLRRIRPLLRPEVAVVEHPGYLDCLPDTVRKAFHVEAEGPVSAHDYDTTALSLIADLSEGLILDCGAGWRKTYHPNVLNLEIAPYASTDVLGVGEELPFKDGVFDAVFSLAVLEHVRDPFRCAAEIIRVLKPGGRLYAVVPFMQHYHGYPHHYFNMTKQGLARLFEDLEPLSHEVPDSGLPIWTASHYLARWAAGLSGPTRDAFLDLTVRELAAEPQLQLERAYVRRLPRAFNEELASTTALVARKPND